MSIEIRECEICYENEPQFICSKCGCKLCFHCIIDYIMKSNKDEDPFNCINCDEPMNEYTIKQILNTNDNLFINLIHHLTENKLQSFENDDINLERCVKAIKLANRFRTPIRDNKQKLIEAELVSSYCGIYPSYIRRDKQLSKLMLIFTNKEICHKSGVKSDNVIYRQQYLMYLNKTLGSALGDSFLFKCENCNNGLVLFDYKCNQCSHNYCAYCWKDITNDDDHLCCNDDVKSVELLISSSKPCPSCAVRIIRDSGCSQMFCTKCHTGFDWNTKRIITGWFENPEREDWINNNHIQTNDIIHNLTIQNINYEEVYNMIQEIRKLNPLITRIYALNYMYYEIISVIENCKSNEELLNERKYKLFRLRVEHLCSFIKDDEYIHEINLYVKDELRYIERRRTYNRFLINIVNFFHDKVNEFNRLFYSIHNEERNMLKCWFDSLTIFSCGDVELNFNIIQFAVHMLNDELNQLIGVNELNDINKSEDKDVQLQLAWKFWNKNTDNNGIIQFFNTCAFKNKFNPNFIAVLNAFLIFPNYEETLHEYGKLIDSCRLNIRSLCEIFGIGNNWIPTRYNENFLDQHKPFIWNN